MGHHERLAVVGGVPFSQVRIDADVQVQDVLPAHCGPGPAAAVWAAPSAATRCPGTHRRRWLRLQAGIVPNIVSIAGMSVTVAENER